MVDELDVDIQENIANVLKLADTPGVRGARAVFVDEDGTIAIGTTVSFNQNWATVEFDDPTIVDKLRNEFTLTIDNSPTVAPTLDTNDNSWNSSGCSDSYSSWANSSC